MFTLTPQCSFAINLSTGRAHRLSCSHIDWMCGTGLLNCDKAELAIRILWNHISAGPPPPPFPQIQASIVTSADLGCPHLARCRIGSSLDQKTKFYLSLHKLFLKIWKMFTVTLTVVFSSKIGKLIQFSSKVKSINSHWIFWSWTHFGSVDSWSVELGVVGGKALLEKIIHVSK